MTIQNCFSKYQKYAIDFLDLELLLAYALDKSRVFVLAHPEYKLTKSQETKINKYISRRIKGIPLAYILGYKEFYSLKFIVNKNVLIPRPETELMIDKALHIARNMKHVTCVDIGTGSGSIIISILKNLIRQSTNDNHKFIATDISKKALSIAQKNAKLHKVKSKIKFIQGNLLEPIISKPKIVNFQSSVVICANLPYLTLKQIRISPSLQYEPKIALHAGVDGLELYERLFKQLKILKNLIPTCAGRPNCYHLLCEIDPCQKKKISSLINKELPRARYKLKKDLKNHTRLAIIKL